MLNTEENESAKIEEMSEEESTTVESNESAADQSSELPALDNQSKEKKEKGNKGNKQRRTKRKEKKEKAKEEPKIIIPNLDTIDDLNYLQEKRDHHNQLTKEQINQLKRIKLEIGSLVEKVREYRNKRDELNKKVQALKKEKDEYIKKIREISENIKSAKVTDVKEKTNDSKAKINKIKKQIKEYELLIETGEISIQEENELVKKIQELEHQLQEITSQFKPSNELKGMYNESKEIKEKIQTINNEIQKIAEESQGFHLLYVDTTKDIDEYNKERLNIEKALDENKAIADEYHKAFIKLSKKKQKVNELSKQMVRTQSPYKSKQIKKEIQNITLKEAKVKQEQGKKLNIFEVRALLEENMKKN